MSGKNIEYENDIKYNEKTADIDDFCTSRGFPLGGLGTGGFSIFTDGGIGKFRTNHNWFKSIGKAEFPKGSFFGLRVENGEKKFEKLLRRKYQGGHEFKNVENIAHTTFNGTIPFFSLLYRDENLPINVKLEGFTSMISHNVKDSSLPVATFTFLLQNHQENNFNISLLTSFENLLGIGGSGGSPLLIFDGPVTYNSTKGNYAEEFHHKDLHGIKLKTKQKYKDKDPRKRVVGEYIIFTDNKIFEIDYNLAWNSDDENIGFWDNFKKNGGIKNADNSLGNSACYFRISWRLDSEEYRFKSRGG